MGRGRAGGRPGRRQTGQSDCTAIAHRRAGPNRSPDKPAGPFADGNRSPDRPAGLGADGRLGLGHQLNATLPEMVPLHQFVRQAAAGATHSACCDSAGCLYTWGDGAKGALGHLGPRPRKNKDDTGLASMPSWASALRLGEALHVQREVAAAPREDAGLLAHQVELGEVSVQLQLLAPGGEATDELAAAATVASSWASGAEAGAAAAKALAQHKAAEHRASAAPE